MIERQMLKIDSLRGTITKNNPVMIQNNLGIGLTARANSSLTEDTTNIQQATSPDAEKTESPTVLRSSQLTPVQRLNIAKAEWSKLFHSNPSQHKSMHRSLFLTHENESMNTPWGDPIREKESDITRIYALNLNGIALDRRGGQFDLLCKIATELQVDVLCGQELNVDTSQSVVRSILYNSAKAYWKRFRLLTGSTNMQFATWYKPGGTMQLAVGHIAGRITSSYTDSMGRWVSQTFKGRNGVNLTLISAYQVVTDSPRLGLTTASAQHRSVMIQMNHQECNLRKAFKSDLRKYLKDCLTRGDDILLTGDFNESIDEHYNGMSSIAAEFHLVDLMKTRSTTKPPSTYARGRLRLDYGLATKRVADSLVAAGYEAFNERFPTDHRAYYFDLNTEKLFGAPTQQLSPPGLRLMQSTNIKQVTQYIREKYRQLEQSNAFSRGYQLSLPGNRHRFAERLDRDVLQASLSSEQKVHKFLLPAWSIALARSREKESTLKKCLSMSRMGRDTSTLLQAALTKGIFESPDSFPSSTKECIDQLRSARREVKEIVAESFKRRENELQDKIQNLLISSSATDKELASILKQIKLAEALKTMFEKIRRFRPNEQKQGITRIEIPVHPSDDPKTCTEWRTIDVPNQIVRQLQRRNRTHFGQAQGTPFTVNPLADELGFAGDGVAAEAILNGAYSPQNLAKNVQLLVEHLKITDEVASLQSYPTITDEEFIGKLKVWKETTTTSPSGYILDITRP
jgi:exonuclease III